MDCCHTLSSPLHSYRVFPFLMAQGLDNHSPPCRPLLCLLCRSPSLTVWPLTCGDPLISLSQWLFYFFHDSKPSPGLLLMIPELSWVEPVWPGGSPRELTRFVGGWGAVLWELCFGGSQLGNVCEVTWFPKHDLRAPQGPQLVKI